MDPGATVNCEVNVWARCWPSEPSTPVGPLGTVTVSVAPGTSGPVAWNWSSDGDSTAQDPATAGVRVGMGLPGARSVENCTEMVDPAATFAPVGDTDATVRATGGAVGVAEASLSRAWSITTKPPAASTSAAAHTATITHARRPFLWRTWSPDMTVDSTGSSGHYRPNSPLNAAMMAERRSWSVTLVPSDSRT